MKMLQQIHEPNFIKSAINFIFQIQIIFVGPTLFFRIRTKSFEFSNKGLIHNSLVEAHLVPTKRREF